MSPAAADLVAALFQLLAVPVQIVMLLAVAMVAAAAMDRTGT